MDSTSTQAETAVLDRPTACTEKMWVSSVSEPKPHADPSRRLPTRNAEFLNKLSAVSFLGDLGNCCYPCRRASWGEGTQNVVFFAEMCAWQTGGAVATCGPIFYIPPAPRESLMRTGLSIRGGFGVRLA